MQLKEGDLLHLSQPVDALLLVEVQDKPMFLAEAGRVRQNRAVRLTERLNEE
jgi:flagellar motor switch protein FliM